MSNSDIIRAWKDEEYRESLTTAARAQLPDSPAGAIELPDDELAKAGGAGTWTTTTTTIAVSIEYCSPRGTLCGTCGWGTRGCCRR